MPPTANCHRFPVKPKTHLCLINSTGKMDSTDGALRSASPSYNLKRTHLRREVFGSTQSISLEHSKLARRVVYRICTTFCLCPTLQVCAQETWKFGRHSFRFQASEPVTDFSPRPGHTRSRDAQACPPVTLPGIPTAHEGPALPGVRPLPSSGAPQIPLFPPSLA